MAALTDLDDASGLATFGAGANGPAVEAALGASGLTLGHYPQSLELSTVGGWVAARSAGQESIGFGADRGPVRGRPRRDAAGPLDLPTHPASAAGRTSASSSSDRRDGPGSSPTSSSGRGRSREATQAFAPSCSVAGPGRWRSPGPWLVPGCRCHGPRLDPARDGHDLRAGRRHARRAASCAATSALRGPDGERCLAIVGVTGSDRVVGAAAREIGAIATAHHGDRASPGVAAAWRRGSASAAPYLRNTLWDAGYAVDTLETAVDWSRLPSRSRRPSAAALRHGLEPLGERVHAFSHLSHVYRERLEPLRDLRLPAGSRPGRDARALAPLKTAASEVDRRRTAGRSATSTASAPTTSRTSRPRRARSGWRRCAARSRRSTRTGSWPRASSSSERP